VKKIELTIKDNMDVAMLLTGINIVRKLNLESCKRYLDLPDNFKKDEIIKDLVDDYDRLNTLGFQLSNLISGGGKDEL